MKSTLDRVHEKIDKITDMFDGESTVFVNGVLLICFRCIYDAIEESDKRLAFVMLKELMKSIEEEQEKENRKLN